MVETRLGEKLDYEVSVENVNKIHKLLRKYRYFYYEMSETLVSDYEYDKLERAYSVMCDRLGITSKDKITNFVGFSFRIPFILVKDTKK